MKLHVLTLRKALNKAFLKVKPNRSDIEVFKENLIRLLNGINDSESEEFHKNIVSDFLKKTYYDPNYSINTKGRNDLVIHNRNTATSTVGVIIEAKKPTNKGEMLTPEKVNAKALHELVLYYLRERITHKNVEIKHLIATNINEWFVFDASVFDRLFAQNKNLVKQFTDFEEGRLADTKTDFFYKQIVEPFINENITDIEFTHFNIQDFRKPLLNADKTDDNKLIPLFKILSPEHLLKLPFTNDSNTLDKRFYSELLHIIGLTETKEGSKKLIERKKEGERNDSSMLESAIIQIDSLDKISRLPNKSQFGETYQERLFNIGLELCITWINRILFLKLLEAQLLAYHKGNKDYEFLSYSKIKDYDDLNSLFFQVLARKHNERKENVKHAFEKIPYLNSSLFEPTDLEHSALFISQLQNIKPIPIFSQTVLKDNTGKKRTGDINPLEYLFEFLNAYDFSSEGSEDIQEENKTLINASVLGLIFEKINGYKDGSFFTPGFITMYMCRETIRRAVVQKFNEANGWNCIDFAELKEDIHDAIKEGDRKKVRKEANEIINSLKICDPAVGSGHFLVSALNEIIAIKSELKILVDKHFEPINDYKVEVVNDELVLTSLDDALFSYTLTDKESQRIQETLFHEKQAIIENCLFGVDINPNSVKICRLRLWIELLKNAYYEVKTGHAPSLQTLPNIDINIKCGNSLVSRYPLNANLKTALKSKKWSIESYRLAIATYRNTNDKSIKREMEQLILNIKQDFTFEIRSNDPLKSRLDKLANELYNRFTGNFLFEPEAPYGMSEKDLERKRKKEQDKLEKEIALLTKKMEEIKSNKIFENAFEWRFEFPEVLNNDGDFVGFDVVIGNPPYIRQEEFSEIKPYLKTKYEIYHPIADLLTFFVELGYSLLKEQGTFQFIISNKFTRANYGQVMRHFLLNKTSLTHFIDFSGIPVFDEATVDAAIIGYRKLHKKPNSFIYANIHKENLDVSKFDDFLNSIKIDFKQENLTDEVWSFESKQVLEIKKKIEAQGVALKDWDITINYGIKTGLNEAFVIDGKKKDEFIAHDPKNAEILKPLLRGRDIQKWQADFQDLWLIYIPWHFPLQNDSNIRGASDLAEKEFSKQYPLIYNYLEGYKVELSNRNSAETGIRYEWYALQRFGSNYWEDFEKPKIIYPNMTKFLPFVIDLEGAYYHNDKSFHLVSNRIYWLGAFFNSKLFDYCFRDNFPELLGGTRELRKVFFDKIPVKKITEEAETPFKELVLQILELKKQNSAANTKELESQIDQLVYELYGLTVEEIAIVENHV